MNKATGLRRIVNAAGYSWHGMRAAFTHEAAFRQELFLTVLLVPAAFFVGVGAWQVAGLIATLLFVLVVELLNSALETIVDRIGPEQHELAGRAKDMGSAAVFVALCLCSVVWLGAIVARFG